VLWGLIAVYVIVRVINGINARVTNVPSSAQTAGGRRTLFQLSIAISISTLICTELLLRLALGAARSRAWQSPSHPLVKERTTLSPMEEQLIKVGGSAFCVCAVLLVAYSRVLSRKHTVGQGELIARVEARFRL
jgi:hypothetical protein